MPINAPRKQQRGVADITSIAHIARQVTEAERHGHLAWIQKQCASKRYYKQRCTRKPDATAANAKKSLASRYYQLKVNKAPTGPYLLWTNRRNNDKCWFCNKSPVQTREHLFKFCARWRK